MATAGKTIACRAAVTKGVNQPYSVEKIELAPPKAGEVRVKMASAGICHSDQHVVEGALKEIEFPIVLGHEGAGIVESVGPGVKSVKPGDGVVLVFEAYCGECDLCKSPLTNQCRKQPRTGDQADGTTRMTWNGKPLRQLASLGLFSEYIVTHEMNVTKVNQKANFNRLCLAGCCIPTGYGAAVNCAKVRPGSTCAVWGLGGVGMNIVLGCRDRKASKIIGIDVNPNKWELAKEFGCTDFVNPRELKKPLKEVLAEMTDGGVDYCFVSVGILPVMDEAFEASNPFWGETIIVGLSDEGNEVKAGVWELLYGRVLKGTYYGSYKAKLAIPGLVDKIMEGHIPLDKLITKTFPLEKINEAYEALQAGNIIRSIIDFDL